jgi:hypothetical protein
MQMAPVYERRTGPRKLELEATLAPATQWNPSLPGIRESTRAQSDNTFVRKQAINHVPLPPMRRTSPLPPSRSFPAGSRTGKLTSERLTEIYLHRMEQFDPKLHCVITLTREHALAQARS